MGLGRLGLGRVASGVGGIDRRPSASSAPCASPEDVESAVGSLDASGVREGLEVSL